MAISDPCLGMAIGLCPVSSYPWLWPWRSFHARQRTAPPPAVTTLETHKFFRYGCGAPRLEWHRFCGGRPGTTSHAVGLARYVKPCRMGGDGQRSRFFLILCASSWFLPFLCNTVLLWKALTFKLTHLDSIRFQSSKPANTLLIILERIVDFKFGAVMLQPCLGEIARN